MSGRRPRTWWGRAWSRATDEAAYDESLRRRARGMVRAGAVGPVSIGPGELRAEVVDGAHVVTAVVTVPELETAALTAFVEVVAAEPTRLAALLDGDLPHAVVEHAEEAGVELLPYGEELGSVCDCASWRDRCVHALAVLERAAPLVEADPLVLLALRGLSREDLVARVASLTRAPDGTPRGTPGEGTAPSDSEIDLDLATEAALRAARLLGEVAGDASDHP